MQRGFIALPILMIILLGTILVGGGGYTVYKINQIESKNNQRVSELEARLQIISTTTAEVLSEEENTELATTSATSSEAEKIEIVEVESLKAPLPNVTKTQEALSPTIDLCANLTGIQASIPVGYKIVGNTCEQLEDKCDNIDGIQAVIPVGMLVFKGYGCMTEGEMDKISEKEREANSAQREADKLSKQCAELKKSVYNMDQQILDIQEKYRLLIEKMYSAGGGSKAGADAQASNYYRQQDTEIGPIQIERNKIANEYNYLCTN